MINYVLVSARICLDQSAPRQTPRPREFNVDLGDLKVNPEVTPFLNFTEWCRDIDVYDSHKCITQAFATAVEHIKSFIIDDIRNTSPALLPPLSPR